ncbi:MAG: COG0262: Dihydrofolate reductase, partial [uncultured Blastococcus sp.]
GCSLHRSRLPRHERRRVHRPARRRPLLADRRRRRRRCPRRRRGRRLRLRRVPQQHRRAGHGPQHLRLHRPDGRLALPGQAGARAQHKARSRCRPTHHRAPVAGRGGGGADGGRLPAAVRRRRPDGARVPARRADRRPDPLARAGAHRDGAHAVRGAGCRRGARARAYPELPGRDGADHVPGAAGV